jgi:N-methylhydantoinase A/oxoprolinase/acetone carboxylase beta subunit
VAFGGAGPLHAAHLAEEIGSPSVFVPPLPGFVSAVGLLDTELRTEVAETVLRPGRRVTPSSLRRSIVRMQRSAVRSLGLEPSRATVSVALDCRYQGQGYELTVPLGLQTWEGIEAAQRHFHRLHDAVYGHMAPDEPVEIVGLRVAAAAPGAGIRAVPIRRGPAPRAAEVRKVFDGEGWIECPAFDRETLIPGWTGRGPLIVREAECTTWVPPRWSVKVDRYGTMELSRG